MTRRAELVGSPAALASLVRTPLGTHDPGVGMTGERAGVLSRRRGDWLQSVPPRYRLAAMPTWASHCACSLVSYPPGQGRIRETSKGPAGQKKLSSDPEILLPYSLDSDLFARRSFPWHIWVVVLSKERSTPAVRVIALVRAGGVARVGHLIGHKTGPLRKAARRFGACRSYRI